MKARIPPTEAKLGPPSDTAEVLPADTDALREAILSASNFLQLTVNLDGYIVEASPSYASLMGFRREELLGTHLSNIHYEWDEERVLKRVNAVLANGQRLIETRHRKRDGSPVLFEVDCSVIEIEGQKLISCFVRDITTRRITELALQKSEAQLKAASRIGKIAYWEYDVANDLFTFNDPFYAIFKTSAEEVGGYQLSSAAYEQRFIHPEDRPIVLEHVKRAIASEEEQFNESFEHRMLYADGSVGHIAVYHYLVRDDQGRIIKTYGANQDITRSKSAEDKLRHANRILHSIREVNKLIKSEKDPDSLLRKTALNLISNRGFEDSWIALVQPSGCIEKLITPHENNELRPTFIPPEKLKWIEEASRTDSEESRNTLHFQPKRYDFTVEGQPYSTLCLPMVFHERHYGYLSITALANLIKTTEEQSLSQELADDLAYALFSFELEEQKALALKELTEAKDIAESANRAKDEFLAVISHEIRTPLNPILGYVHLLKRKSMDTTSQTYLDSIERAAQQQLSLIDNILNFTRLDRGRITPTPSDFSLQKLCHHAVLDARQSRSDLSIELLSDPQYNEVPQESYVYSDKSMLQELLSNLLSNACKYTPSGEVRLSIGYEDTADEKMRVHFAVTDTGIGIPQETQQKLFTPFTQADTSYTRKYEGAGLGLAICRKLVDLMEGEIGVESTEGKGSRFWFWIDLPISNESPEPQPGEQQPQVDECLKTIDGKHVLLVEDNAENSALTRFLLEGYGAKVTVAANGIEGIERCEAQTFDIILMDLAMPMLDGYGASKRIRESDNLNKSTPILVLTADASPGTEKRCAAFGFEKFLTKPIDIMQLAEAIHHTLANR